jgi:hypothetical protein
MSEHGGSHEPAWWKSVSDSRVSAPSPPCMITRCSCFFLHLTSSPCAVLGEGGAVARVHRAAQGQDPRLASGESTLRLTPFQTLRWVVLPCCVPGHIHMRARAGARLVPVCAGRLACYPRQHHEMISISPVPPAYPSCSPHSLLQARCQWPTSKNKTGGITPKRGFSFRATDQPTGRREDGPTHPDPADTSRTNLASILCLIPNLDPDPPHYLGGLCVGSWLLCGPDAGHYLHRVQRDVSTRWKGKKGERENRSSLNQTPTALVWPQ